MAEIFVRGMTINSWQLHLLRRVLFGSNLACSQEERRFSIQSCPREPQMKITRARISPLRWTVPVDQNFFRLRDSRSAPFIRGTYYGWRITNQTPCLSRTNREAHPWRAVPTDLRWRVDLSLRASRLTAGPISHFRSWLLSHDATNQRGTSLKVSTRLPIGPPRSLSVIAIPGGLETLSVHRRGTGSVFRSRMSSTNPWL